MTKFFYRVEQGETLFGVSNKLSVPCFKIIRQNNLTREIEQGDLLYIEKSSEKGKFYKVKPFDTLDSVCEKFCVDKQELAEKNGVDYLFYGLIIEI